VGGAVAVAHRRRGQEPPDVLIAIE